MTTTVTTTQDLRTGTRQDPSRARLPRTARRAQLLTAAQEVFVAQGYHAAAMDEIAERAGVSKPVLYQHFPGKLDLYLALLEQNGDELVAAVRRALASTTENKHRVAATVQAYFDFVDREGAAFRLVFESDLTNEPAVRDRVERVSQTCAEAIAAVIEEDTGLSPDESMLLGVAMTGMAQVTARWWTATGGGIPRDAAAALVARMQWRGIRGFPRAVDASTGMPAPMGVPAATIGSERAPGPGPGARSRARAARKA